MIRNITNIVLVIIVLGLIYFNRSQSKEIIRQEAAIHAANDTLHTFKTKYNSVGGYISVIEANKGLALQLLGMERSRNKDLIALLDSNKTVQHATKIETITKTYYEKVIDTVYKNVNFKDSIKTEWTDQYVEIKDGKLKMPLVYREAYIYHVDKKDNKGWFTGKTLTAYAEPKNPNTKVTDLRSVSTVVDKRKPRLGPYVGGGLSVYPEEQLLDISKYKVKPTIQLGIGLTF